MRGEGRRFVVVVCVFKLKVPQRSEQVHARLLATLLQSSRQKAHLPEDFGLAVGKFKAFHQRRIGEEPLVVAECRFDDTLWHEATFGFGGGRR